MKLRHIEVFNAVYTYGSVSSAARLLNITQPTASKILKHAEDSLGFPLFHRIRGRLVATEAAEVLHRQTADIYDRLAVLRRTSQNLSKRDEGFLRIGSVSALGLELLPQAVASFHRIYPQVRFEIRIRNFDSMIDRLYERDKDIALALNPPSTDGIAEIAIGMGEFVCVYADGEFDRHPGRIKLRDLRNAPVISIDDSGPLGGFFTSLMHQNGIGHDPIIVAQTHLIARNLAANRAGIAVVDEFTARSHSSMPVKLKAFDPPIMFAIKALFLENHSLTECNMRFIDHLRDRHLDCRAPL